MKSNRLTGASPHGLKQRSKAGHSQTLNNLPLQNSSLDSSGPGLTERAFILVSDSLTDILQM